MIEEHGIDTKQLRVHIVRPALKHIELHSPAAENLVVGTALVESRGRFVKQVGGGPALGLWQMEPATQRDIHENYLRFKPQLRESVELLMTALGEDDETEIMGNLFFGAAMCRVHYWRVPDALPAAGDYEAMAAYWKSHYNTPRGAGTVEKAIPFFRAACAEGHRNG